VIRLTNKNFYFVLFFFLLFFKTVNPANALNIADEYDLKESYVYNFLKFVSFPASQQKEYIEICLAGENPFGKKIFKLSEKTIDGKKLIVSEKEIDDSIKSCDVIFISKNQDKKISKILEIINNHPVFSISESQGVSEPGCVLNFYVENERLRFEINVAAVKKAGLTIDSRLLNLAKIIKPKE
jgi:hypothetical protein